MSAGTHVVDDRPSNVEAFVVSRFYEDFEVGDVFRSPVGRTLNDADVWIAPDSEGAAEAPTLVSPETTLLIMLDLSMEDTSEGSAATIGLGSIAWTTPVHVGDTIWAETEILWKRDAIERPEVGVVSLRTRGRNQRVGTVIQFTRMVMLPKRTAPRSAWWPASSAELAGNAARRLDHEAGEPLLLLN